MATVLFRLFLIICIVIPASGQFDTKKYEKFLEDNKALTADAIQKKYDAGLFEQSLNVDYSAANYFYQTDTTFRFTPQEKDLLSRHSFMVTERVSYPSFVAGFYEIYKKDLPVYISADAILHALHRSYDNMLKDIELIYLRERLNSALESMTTQLGKIAINSSLGTLERTALRDADVYLTVAKKLSYGFSSLPPLLSENKETVVQILALIDKEQLARYPLFAEAVREIDFSQFKPRGHYAENEYLQRYFKTIMWLGRTELYITPPETEGPKPSKEDVRRQCALAVMLANVAKESGALSHLNAMDSVISAFVGGQDNLTTDNLLDVIAAKNLTIPMLADDAVVDEFQKSCIATGAEQRILSQLLWAGPGVEIKPAAAYMLMGQRFIIDSYVFMNVVFDKVDKRMMPSTLDAMFALGNNSALQLLRPELEKYEGENYPRNLAALRYLVDSYGESDWNSSLYATWLGAIRSLSPPDHQARAALPDFMKTAAWWQKSLNAQLTSWAELRHDNLLYAKQSYTGGNSCFYPDGFVEPVPALYASIARFASRTSEILKRKLDTANYSVKYMLGTYGNFLTVMPKLESMAQKELRSEQFSTEEKDLIGSWIMQKVVHGCGSIDTFYNGWYPKLMYGYENSTQTHKPDFIVADVHTQPTDYSGSIVGRVLHVGTGAPTLAVIVAKDRDGCATTYSGPVSSYFEHISENFQRLTDEEWREMYLKAALRPNLVNLYMATDKGEIRANAPTLLMGNDIYTIPVKQPVETYPNPFAVSTIIGFAVPTMLSGERVTVSVFGVNGSKIASIFDQRLDAGNYTVRWDGMGMDGARVARGAYTYRLTIGGNVYTGVVVLTEP